MGSAVGLLLCLHQQHSLQLLRHTDTHIPTHVSWRLQQPQTTCCCWAASPQQQQQHLHAA
jgi:hypothetical protein